MVDSNHIKKMIYDCPDDDESIKKLFVSWLNAYVEDYKNSPEHSNISEDLANHFEKIINENKDYLG